MTIDPNSPEFQKFLDTTEKLMDSAARTGYVRDIGDEVEKSHKSEGHSKLDEGWGGIHDEGWGGIHNELVRKINCAIVEGAREAYRSPSLDVSDYFTKVICSAFANAVVNAAATAASPKPDAGPATFKVIVTHITHALSRYFDDAKILAAIQEAAESGMTTALPYIMGLTDNYKTRNFYID